MAKYLYQIPRLILGFNRALYWASRRGYTNMAMSLIDMGADPNGRTTGRGLSDWFHFPFTRSPDDYYIPPPIMGASHKGHIKVVQLLLHKGADPNIKSEDGFTALGLASVRGHAEVVKMLIDNGAEPNAENNDGMTPLMLAAMGAYNDVVRVLLDKGADPNYRNKTGGTALVGAAGKNHIDIVKILVNKEADLNTKDYEKGMTALMWAAFNDCRETVEFLLEKGADMDAKNSDGMTSLMIAIMTNITRGSGIFGIYRRKIDGIKLFIDYEADVNVIDNNGRSALMWAAYENLPEIVVALIDKGADQRIRNKDGLTALELAKKKDWYKVVRVLEKSD